MSKNNQTEATKDIEDIEFMEDFAKEYSADDLSEILLETLWKYENDPPLLCRALELIYKGIAQGDEESRAEKIKRVDNYVENYNAAHAQVSVRADCQLDVADKTEASLREQFEDGAKIKTDKQLEKAVGDLKKKIQRAQGKGKKALVLRIKTESSSGKAWAYLGDVKASAGYKKLHAICAGDDVDMRIEIDEDYRFTFRERHDIVITITLNSPYRTSPDAAALGMLPARPRSRPGPQILHSPK